MKKLLLVLLLTLGLFAGVTTVRADIGPKPSLKVTIIGMEDTPYTFDLLSEDVDGNFIDPNGDAFDLGHYLDLEDYPEELFTFTCHDNLSVWSLYGHPMPYIKQTDDTTNAQVYQENYHPPREFKVLIYLEDGTSIVSKLVSRNYFDSHMTWDVTNVDKTTSSEGLGEISGNVHIGPYDEITGWDKLSGVAIPRMVLRILITMSIELGILFLFRYKKKESYILVSVTNAITQILLTYIVASTAVYSGYFQAVFILLFLEAFVFVIEGTVYGFLLKERKTAWALLYAFIANTATLITGFFLVLYL
jgi:hypothetical protein